MFVKIWSSTVWANFLLLLQNILGWAFVNKIDVFDSILQTECYSSIVGPCEEPTNPIISKWRHHSIPVRICERKQSNAQMGQKEGSFILVLLRTNLGPQEITLILPKDTHYDLSVYLILKGSTATATMGTSPIESIAHKCNDVTEATDLLNSLGHLLQKEPFWGQTPPPRHWVWVSKVRCNFEGIKIHF